MNRCLVKFNVYAEKYLVNTDLKKILFIWLHFKKLVLLIEKKFKYDNLKNNVFIIKNSIY